MNMTDHCNYTHNLCSCEINWNKTIIVLFQLIIIELRESSLNMTREGDEDIETQSLKF